MRYHIFTKDIQDKYPICFLVTTINAADIKKTYIDGNFNKDEVLILDLFSNSGTKKTTAKDMRDYLQQEVFPVLLENKVEYLLVGDSSYFKVLTKAQKVDSNLGYVMDCEFGPWKVVYIPNYRSVFYDPAKIMPKIKQGIDVVLAHRNSSYVAPGQNIIKYAMYPDTLEDIEQALIYLLEMEKPLTIDIETFNLKHPKSGIGTISFAWDQHSGIAFAVDYEPIPDATEAPFGVEEFNAPVRSLLRSFFLALKKKAIYHNIAFDAYILIYQLFMSDLLDTEGLLNGIDVMLRDWDDTKLITYLATNSCAGNSLGLKDQAQAYAGNYAIDNITDICSIPLNKLLQYNLVDALSTWHVYNKHWGTLVHDNQEDVYKNIFKPATIDIIQMQLTGMPICMEQVVKVKTILTTVLDSAIHTLRNSDVIKAYEYARLENFTNLKNDQWVKKRMTISEVAEFAKTNEAFRKNIIFNPNSGPQLQELLFNVLGLPVISLTDTKQPSVDRDTLESLSKRQNEPKTQEFLLAMLDYVAVNKILTAFIPALENAALAKDGWHYLFGNFNLGGTLSGRLSSSEPNLQNIPANVMMVISDYLKSLLGESVSPYLSDNKLSLGKLIKSCFKAPDGWVFAGLDFASLEDRISALTTKDPNKLKVYTDGYDGHSLRAVSYFGDNMPDIELAPAGAECYTANVGGTDIYFHSEENVEYLGTNMKGKELYALITNSRL